MKSLKEIFTLHELHEEPIRLELLSTICLEKQGETLAKSQKISSHPILKNKLSSRVSENEKVLVTAYSAITKTLNEQRSITLASEWLIDNFHIVEDQLRDIRDHLPPKYYKQLPKLSSGHLKGYPRVYGITWDFIAHTDSLFDPELFKNFIKSYQKIKPLTIGELWALPITLRIVMIENLRRITANLVGSQWARKEADHIADELLDFSHHSNRTNEEIITALAKQQLSYAFIAQFVQRLRFQEGKATVAIDWLETRLHHKNLVADMVVHEEHVRQTTANATVRNIITSMRLMSAIDWRDVFEG